MTAAAAKNHSKKTEEGDAPQYAGPIPPQVYPKGKVTTGDEKSEDQVIGEGGMITHPTLVTIAMNYKKEGNDEERFAGKVLLQGDTYGGYHYQSIVEVPQPLTKEGLFHVFKSHFPDGQVEKFSFKALSTADAEKLVKEWQAEREGKKEKE